MNVELSWLEGGTWYELQRRLNDSDPWHIFHYIGHGGYDDLKKQGYLALEERNGGVKRLYARELARILSNHASLRLAVLNSCDGSRGDEEDLFSSSAITLQRQGRLPAVIAMQFPVSDRVAIEFARLLYGHIADGVPIDAAMALTRQGLTIEYRESMEWATPVLYMRSNNGMLFQLPSKFIVNQTELQEMAEVSAMGSNEVRGPNSFSSFEIFQLLSHITTENDLIDLISGLSHSTTGLQSMNFEELDGNTANRKLQSWIQVLQRSNQLPHLIEYLQVSEQYRDLFPTSEN